MPLFTDGGPASIEDLKRYDSSAEMLAHDAGIDLDAKLSVAAEELGQEIFGFLLFQSGSTSMNPMLSLPPGETTRQRIGLADVVVTPALRRWHALEALNGLYRDAYASDVTDRFRLKWKEYEKLAKEAADYSFTTGIGLARNPVPKAPLGVVSEASQVSARTDCSIRATWVNQTGAEGAPSDLLQAGLGAGDQVTLPGSPPGCAIGWNIYVGQQDGLIQLQNQTPLGVNSAWTMPLGSLRSGKTVTEAQLPDCLVIERRILPRG